MQYAADPLPQNLAELAAEYAGEYAAERANQLQKPSLEEYQKLSKDLCKVCPDNMTQDYIDDTPSLVLYKLIGSFKDCEVIYTTIDKQRFGCTLSEFKSMNEASFRSSVAELQINILVPASPEGYPGSGGLVLSDGPQYTNLWKISGENVRSLGAKAFADIVPNLTVFNFPNVEDMGESIVAGSKVQILNFPKLQRISELTEWDGIKYSGSLYYTYYLKEFHAPQLVLDTAQFDHQKPGATNPYGNGTIKSPGLYRVTLKSFVDGDDAYGKGNYIFNDQSNLVEVNLTEGCPKTLGICAFDGCVSLRKANLSNARRLKNAALRGTRSLEQKELWNIMEIQDLALRNSAITTLQLVNDPNGATIEIDGNYIRQITHSQWALFGSNIKYLIIDGFFKDGFRDYDSGDSPPLPNATNFSGMRRLETIEISGRISDEGAQRDGFITHDGTKTKNIEVVIVGEYAKDEDDGDYDPDTNKWRGGIWKDVKYIGHPIHSDKEGYA
ncbi:MAG: leucine-rich repeat protein [Holosporales bacterium]|nr:leucine-rich repeat protein [Holosporales bacterium]